MTPPQDPRMTQTTQAVLRALLENPSREMYGLEICGEAELPSGTIYPILARLEKIGWLESSWEAVELPGLDRPRRRYYHLSREGAERARHALALVTESRAALRRLRPGISTGGVA